MSDLTATPDSDSSLGFITYDDNTITPNGPDVLDFDPSGECFNECLDFDNLPPLNFTSPLLTGDPDFSGVVSTPTSDLFDDSPI